MRLIRQFANNNRGATVIEYGLICSLIVVAILVSLNLLAGRVVGMWGNVSTAVVNAN